MKKYTFKTVFKKLLADTATPVSIYLRLRDVFPNSILLESSDYHAKENSMSFICCQPVAGVELHNETYIEKYPDGEIKKFNVAEIDIKQKVDAFRNSFDYQEQAKFGFISNGLFGYFKYDVVKHFHSINLKAIHNDDIPLMAYNCYRYVIAINHFKNELYVFEHNFDAESSLDRVVDLIRNSNFPQYQFQSTAKEESNFTDNEFLSAIAKAKTHIKRGDVFQLVLSRLFTTTFTGDEFNVYRALRSINPSPYLFYFDYGNFKIFGSSPEAQLTIKNKKASIYPIAGTFLRTGDDIADALLAEELKTDAKESAEHVMLVDLARNDLNRNCDGVHVEQFKEIQFYSHVIHLVSKISGTLKNPNQTMQITADTFPAGTLSGAPKHRAMQLIDEIEPDNRSTYGGAIGYLGFNGDFNHAIMIRSFVSQNNTLYYRAGAGIVDKSEPEKELAEVNNKLAALRKSIHFANEI